MFGAALDILEAVLVTAASLAGLAFIGAVLTAPLRSTRRR